VDQHVIISTGLDSGEDSQIDLNEVASIDKKDTATLGLDGLSVATFDDAVAGIASAEKALETINQNRGSIGATQNRFQRALKNLNVAAENLNAAYSVIADADIAEEVAGLTKQQLLVQSSSAMVGQANLIPQGVLLLLQQ